MHHALAHLVGEAGGGELLSPWDLGSRPQGAFIYLGTFAIVLALAEVTERKKHVWRAALQWLIHPQRDGWAQDARPQR